MFCSPVLRARETAGILSDTLHIPFQVTEALREYDCGVLEEQGDEESWAQHHYFFTEWMLCRNLDRKPEGGESFRDIERRFVPFVESLRARNAGNMLLVGHGGLFLLMLPVLLVNIDNEFVLKHGIDHTECILAKSHTSGWICKEWGNISL
jgi:probable phosphoglycerate mutase